MYRALADVFGDSTTVEIFGESATIDAWLETERALALAQAELGVIPAAAAAEIQKAARGDRVDADLLRARTSVVGYPILPLLEQVVSDAPSAVGSYLHWGTTTQDVMDTSQALQISRGSRTSTVRP